MPTTVHVSSGGDEPIVLAAQTKNSSLYITWDRQRYEMRYHKLLGGVRDLEL